MLFSFIIMVVTLMKILVIHGILPKQCFNQAVIISWFYYLGLVLLAMVCIIFLQLMSTVPYFLSLSGGSSWMSSQYGWKSLLMKLLAS